MKSDTFQPKVICGFGDINFGKQYRQGNRVYSAECIATALMAEPIGNMGGYSNLYLVIDNGNKTIGTLNPNSSQRRIVFDSEYISPTLTAAAGEGGGQNTYGFGELR